MEDHLREDDAEVRVAGAVRDPVPVDPQQVAIEEMFSFAKLKCLRQNFIKSKF